MNGHTYSASSFRCHDFAAAAPTQRVIAGATLDLHWTLTAPHPGDCFLYVSYDEPSTAFPGTSHWFKVADFLGCVDQQLLGSFSGVAPPVDNRWTMTLPSWLPSSSHAVLRWEWHAVQQTANVEVCRAAAPTLGSHVGAELFA
jgi:hypothetical protein